MDSQMSPPPSPVLSSSPQNTELLSALASLLQSGKYSDLTIACGMQRYSVHRAIICSRSSFFDGACRNPFKESETGVIDLSEDDPEAVEHMIKYLYHLDYLNTPISRRTSQRSKRSSRAATLTSTRIPTRQRSLKMKLALADDPLLAMAGANNAQTPLTPPDEQPNQFEPEHATKRPATPEEDERDEATLEEPDHAETEEDTEKTHLLTHAKVYAIAEKYGISGLKQLAKEKYARQIAVHYTSLEFAESCQEAYESTVDSDRGLRDVIVHTFRTHPELSMRKDVELIVRDTPSLAFELYRMANGLPVFA